MTDTTLLEGISAEVAATVVDLVVAAQRRLDDLERFAAASVPDLRMKIADRAVQLCQILDAKDESSVMAKVTLRSAAHDVCMTMLGSPDDPGFDFWRTKLGQDVAWAIGYPEPVVPREAAQAILGRTRSGIYHMINHMGLQLTAAGICNRVRAEYRRG